MCHHGRRSTPSGASTTSTKLSWALRWCTLDFPTALSAVSQLENEDAWFRPSFLRSSARTGGPRSPDWNMVHPSGGTISSPRVSLDYLEAKVGEGRRAPRTAAGCLVPSQPLNTEDSTGTTWRPQQTRPQELRIAQRCPRHNQLVVHLGRSRNRCCHHFGAPCMYIYGLLMRKLLYMGKNVIRDHIYLYHY